jgi:hypothetical protein
VDAELAERSAAKLPRQEDLAVGLRGHRLRGPGES